jgi:hypothetical protein
VMATQTLKEWHGLHGKAEPGAADAAVAHQRVRDQHGGVDADREADPLGAPW